MAARMPVEKVVKRSTKKIVKRLQEIAKINDDRFQIMKI